MTGYIHIGYHFQVEAEVGTTDVGKPPYLSRRQKNNEGRTICSPTAGTDSIEGRLILAATSTTAHEFRDFECRSDHSFHFP